MSEKTFSVEKPFEQTEQSYKGKILKIINDLEESIRYVNPEKDKGLHNELHAEKALTTRNEIKDHEEIRKDICESFGVSFDSEHVFLYSKGDDVKRQRAERAFVVLIDLLKKEGFYGEGRISHNVLLNGSISLLNAVSEEVVDPEKVYDGIESHPPRYLTFKGFLSNKGFSSLSEGSVSMLRTPIVDGDGQVIETPDTWFLTGHSLEGFSPSDK